MFHFRRCLPSFCMRQMWKLGGIHRLVNNLYLVISRFLSSLEYLWVLLWCHGFTTLFGRSLMLWAYGGGQKTQWSCFWYKMLISFILSSISATHGLWSELYRYEPTQWRQTSIATGWANEGCTKMKCVPKGIPKRYTKEDKEDKEWRQMAKRTLQCRIINI